jgi:hypothetical protein
VKITGSRNLLVVPTAAALIGITLAGCVEAPPRRYVEAPRPAPVINTEVYAYPRNGQTAEDQKRDRYECYNWAVKQTGFDPSRMPTENARVVHVEPSVAPNHDAAVLGVTGAIIGAAVSRPSNALGGAAIGAVLGAAAGSASDANREATAEHIERSANAANQRGQYAQLSQRAAEYRRAMSACLEGRGYSVSL